jgi:DNA-binding NarL/FixJ family response regulator
MSGGPGTSGAAGGVRVVLVDDHALMRQGIRTILSLQAGIEVVGEASSGEEAVEVVARTRPDVVCMDVEMPGIGGLEATRRILAEPGATVQVLVLTTFEREDYLLAALEAGASGFLLKNSPPERLVAGVRAIAAGDALLAPELTRAVIERAVARERERTPLAQPPVGHGAQSGTAPENLTARETEVLRLLAQGLSNDEIAELLVVGRATVKTHVSNVLTKLSLRDRVQAVAFAYRSGLVDPRRPSEAPPS